MPEELVVETDNELLNDEVPEVEDEELIETDEEKEEEDKENKEKDKDEEEKKEDDRFPHERYSLSEIREKYPEIFKEFPGLRDSIFREIEYTKTFPTIEDAKDALEDSIALSGLRESVLAGKSEDVLDAIEQTDKKAAEKFVTTFLPTLYKKNNELYTAAVTPLFETLVRNLGRQGDENLRNAGLVVAHFIWGDNGIKIAKGEATFAKSTEPSEEEKRLGEERNKLYTEQFTGFQNTVLSDLATQRKSLIMRGLDPDKSMTEGQREMLFERIEKLVDQALAADASHMSVMNARWLRSKKEGFNSASKDKIVAAYLSRAKQVIPSIREKERNAFLGTRGKAAKSKIEEIDTKSSREKTITSGRVSGSSKEVLKPTKELFRKMSDIDILNAN
jgi:hypothetical protein